MNGFRRFRLGSAAAVGNYAYQPIIELINFVDALKKK
jgi:hypothetical protein